MNWLPTFLFWGGLAAGIPIVLHLFFRSRYRVVQWAAMEFLLKSIQETSRRLKFQELLLLLLRILVFTLLALVLALTIWRVAASWGGQGAVDAILLIDVSASMNAKEGTRTRLDMAKAAAEEILDGLPPSSTVRVVLMTDRARLIGPRQPANFEQAREVIRSIEVSSRPTDFLAGMEEARDLFRLGANPNREIYLISDHQKQGLTQSAALRTLCEAMERENTRIFAVQCGEQTPRNAAIDKIVSESGILHTGTRASFSVMVRNTGSQTVRDLKVSLKLLGQEKGEDSRTLPSIEPGEQRPVPLSIELKQPGYQVLSATIESDDLAADNHYEQVLHIHDQVRVLIVDGDPNPRKPDRAGSHFLATALTPVTDTARDRYFIKTRVVTPRQATPIQLSDRDVVILVDVPLRPRLTNEGGHLSADFLDELSKFVREGKGLMVFGGPHVVAADYNEELVTKRPLLPLRLGDTTPAKLDEKIFTLLDPTSIPALGLFDKFRTTPALARLLAQESVLQFHDTADLTPEEKSRGGASVLLKYANGRPALGLKQVERGKVLLCTTTANLAWNDLAKSPVFLPIIFDAVAELLQSDVQGYNRTVGQPLLWSPTLRNQSMPHLLTPPVGDEVRLGLPKGDDGKALYLVDDTDRAGVYRIRVENDGDPEKITNLDREENKERGVVFAVTADPGESLNLEPGTRASIDEGLGVKVTHLSAGQTNLGGQLSERRSQSWTELLILVLVLLLAESALAWYCGRAW